MIDFNRFTNYSQEIIFGASAKMNYYKNPEIQPEHIMLTMIEDTGISKDYLTELKLLNQDFINAIVSKIKTYPVLSNPQNPQQLFVSTQTNRLLEIADSIAKESGDEFIGIESILLAMTKLEGSGIQEILTRFRVNEASVKNVIKKKEKEVLNKYREVFNNTIYQDMKVEFKDLDEYSSLERKDILEDNIYNTGYYSISYYVKVDSLDEVYLNNLIDSFNSISLNNGLIANNYSVTFDYNGIIKLVEGGNDR